MEHNYPFSAIVGQETMKLALILNLINPVLGGGGAKGGREILPTGRNMHGGEWGRVPTQVAYWRGRDAADALINLHLREKGRLAEKAAINMTSLDIV